MRVFRRIGAAVMVLAIAGCDGLLEVSNPGSRQEEQLNDPALQQFLVNGAIGELQFAYGRYVLWSAVLSDELYADHIDLSIRALARHDFDDLNSPNNDVYSSLQRARQSADDATARLKLTLGANAASSLDVTRTLVYGGYAYVLLGEGFCDAPVDGGSALSPDELLGRAVARFDEAIVVATAASAGTDAAAAQDLISMAHVGAARASLKRGAHATARAHAALVPDAYERWAYYSANSVRENNALQTGASASRPFLGMHPIFQRLDDARVPQPAAPRLAVGGTAILPPLKPSMYSGWSATASAPIENATHIRIASGLEARYVGLEADGPSGAMLTFVNGRRAVAGKAAVTSSGTALMAELRAQRAIDFYLTGQRLGDLRRYAAAGLDLFPRGTYPVPPDSYGSRRCFIV